MADFETSTPEWFEHDGEVARVWAWGLADVFKATSVFDVKMGTTIEGFMDTMENIGGVVWFHNLRFDGSFILDWLLRNGYRHNTEQFLRAGEFCTLISSEGNFYTIRVKWHTGLTTEFRDSLKKLPMPVADVAKTFNLPVVKGELDYKTYREPGHRLTREEREYLAHDVLIMAMALRFQLEQGMTAITIGSDALSEYKSLVGSKLFTRLFPILPQETDDIIRKSYRGGYTYVADRFRAKPLGSGRVYDVNSLYPSVMYSELLPHGEPVPFEGFPHPTDTYPLYIVTVTFTARLKRNKLPCIQVKGSIHFNSVEYQRIIKEPVTLTCTSVDLALWQDHYNMDILSMEGGFYFRAATGVFKEYIDKWMKIKAESTGGMRQLAKLQLNSLYGKFATRTDVTGKIPVLEDNIVKLKMGEPEEREPVYTAMGAFITAYARDKTTRAAQDNYSVFAYADTDSLHLLTDTDPDNLHIHPSELGAWKFEYAFTEARYQAPKRYIEKRADTGSYEVHVAGLPARLAVHLTPDDFGKGKIISAMDLLDGTHVEGKLKPRRVPGGIVLEETPFTLDQ